MAIRRGLLTSLVGALLGACLLAGLALTALQFQPQLSPTPLGFTVLACARVSFQPRLQVEASWIIPQVLSSIIPVPPWSRGCIYLPWLPVLPLSGFWRFPP